MNTYLIKNYSGDHEIFKSSGIDAEHAVEIIADKVSGVTDIELIHDNPNCVKFSLNDVTFIVECYDNVEYNVPSLVSELVGE